LSKTKNKVFVEQMPLKQKSVIQIKQEQFCRRQ